MQDKSTTLRKHTPAAPTRTASTRDLQSAHSNARIGPRLMRWLATRNGVLGLVTRVRRERLASSRDRPTGRRRSHEGARVPSLTGDAHIRWY